MELGITIGISVLLVVLGLWGLFRGVRLGVMSLVGTLLAAVVVDLWNKTWIYWLDHWFHVSPTTYWHFGTASLAFIAVVFFIGYGSGVLLPVGSVPKKKKIPDRLLGGLLGVVNGALIAAFLVRYAYIMIGSELARSLIKSTLLANTLRWWLPWFVLLTVIVLFLVVVGRTLYFFFKARRAAAAAAAAKKEEESTDDVPDISPAEAEAEQAVSEIHDPDRRDEPQSP